jgi:NAD(P)-dependent dehydrogenase (short-subunit alcohol dehydrogenase family)
MNSNLRGKWALITGAGGLLGLEHAIALCEEECNLVLTDLPHVNLDEKIKSLNAEFPKSKIAYFGADLTKKDDVENLAELISKISPKIDVLINNAAYNPPVYQINHEIDNSVENYPYTRWEQELKVNLSTAFLCCQAFGTQMASTGGGVIINIASDLSVIAPDNRIYSHNGKIIEPSLAKPISYSVSKTALVGLTRYLAAYWANSGVRVNALSPGGVENNHSEDFVDKLVSRIPMARMAKRNEYRGAIVFLASDASKYMTGQNLIIDGGRTII